MNDTTSTPRADRFWIPRLLVALLLLAAAAMKVHQLATAPLPGQGVWANRWLHFGEAAAEIGLGIWLLSHVARRLAWLVAVLCFVAFSVVTFLGLLRGDESCGCFGRLVVPPAITLVLDVAMVVLLVIFRPRSGGWWPQSWRQPAVAAAVFAVLVGAAAVPVVRFKPAVLSGDGMIGADDVSVVLQPETWVGQPLPIAPHIDVAKPLSHGTWLAVLVHDGCMGCRALVPQLAQKLRENPGARVAIIQLPPVAARSDLVPADAGFLVGRLDGSRDWFVETPAAIWLKDGLVTKVIVAKGDDNRARVLAEPLPLK